MKLYQYDDIKKLNQALHSFAKNGVIVEKVETITVGDKLQHFVLADQKLTPKQPKTKVESKTEDEAKKTIKEKKEKKTEEKAK
jgi:hypothetical protein